ADGARDEPVLDRHALLHAEPLHEVLHPVGAEDAKEVVLQREEEPGRPGIALPTAAAAELVVDSPRLVPLRTEDVEPARRDDLLALGRAHLAVALENLLVAGLVLLRRLLELLADLLDLVDVHPAALLVAPLGRAERLLVRTALLLVEPLGLDVRLLGGAVLGADVGEVAVSADAGLHEEGELEGRQPALVLRATLVELAGDVVGPVPDLLPRLEDGLIARAELLEPLPLRRDRRAAAGAEERRLDLLLDVAVSRR